MSHAPFSTGLLIAGHGSRDPRAPRCFAALVDRIASLVPGVPVEGGFLELCSPSIRDALDALADRGVRDIVVAPLLLLAAGHVRRDIPAAVREAAARRPDVRTCQVEHLGCHPAIVALSARRFEQALGGAAAASHETGLVLVGRGSTDRRAIEEMRRLARLRTARTPVRHASVGFLAMAQPRLETVLEAAARWGVPRVVVQPHLLFPGALTEKTEEAVQAARAQWPRIEWRLTGPLGPDPRVAWAVLDAAGRSTAACNTTGCCGNQP